MLLIALLIQKNFYQLLQFYGKNWSGLQRYCDDGRYGMDTNRVKNAIRPFCVGRNYESLVIM
jgi:hypothetical protein